MNTASRAISSAGLKRRALSLGAVKAFDHALQFLLPVVLVRCLDTAGAVVFAAAYAALNLRRAPK